MNNSFFPCSSSYGADHFNMMGYGFGGGVFGGIAMIIWWAVIIVVLIVAVKWVIKEAKGHHGERKEPLDILKERYAKGEINKEEFEEKKNDVMK